MSPAGTDQDLHRLPHTLPAFPVCRARVDMNDKPQESLANAKARTKVCKVLKQRSLAFHAADDLK